MTLLDLIKWDVEKADAAITVINEFIRRYANECNKRRAAIPQDELIKIINEIQSEIINNIEEDEHPIK